MTATRTLGAAVVGLGIGEQHARAYAEIDACSLRWLYDRDGQRSRDLAGRLGEGAPAESFEQILDDDGVDMVSIASYDDAHAAQVLAALRAGKHVFVEKPLCRTGAELKAIKAEWMGRGTPHLASNLVLRAAPLYEWLRRAIESGDLGDVYAFDGEYLYGRLEKITDDWRGAVRDYSVMLGGGVHLVDLMLRLTGQLPNRVSSVGNRLCSAGTRFQYDDYVAATFWFASGLIGRITANFGCVHRHQHVVRVFGTKATFLFDDQGARLHTSRAPDLPAVPLTRSPLPAGKADLIPRFVDGILTDADTRGQTQHEFNVISACVAADRALHAAEPVDIDYA